MPSPQFGSSVDKQGLAPNPCTRRTDVTLTGLPRTSRQILILLLFEAKRNTLQVDASSFFRKHFQQQHRTEHADLQERFLKIRFYVRRRSSRVCLIRFKVVALYKWAAMEKLSNAERAAELVYDGMRRGKLSRDDFVRKMSGLESLGKD